MAYVGTPTRLATARDTLASIIQGEAGGEGLRGMQAVAQVITNRAAQNFSGYGTDLISQATARNQFQGQSTSRISANAYAVADQALNGTLPNVVGSGAVNYANPGASSARWARNLDGSNSFQLGNHFFTDNTNGRPYTPDLSPNGNNVETSAPGTSSGVSGDGLNYSQPGFQPVGSVETSAGSIYKGSDAQLMQDAQSGTVNLDFADGSSGVGYGAGGGASIDAGSFSTADVSQGVTGGSFGLGGITSGGQTVGTATGTGGAGNGLSLDGATLDKGVTAGTVAEGGDDIAGYNSAGPVVANPALVGATNAVANATTKGDQAIQKGVQTAGQTIGQSITSSTQSVLSWLTDSLLRVFVLLVGLALFAGALYYFGKPAIDNAVSKMPKVVPVPI